MRRFPWYLIRSAAGIRSPRWLVGDLVFRLVRLLVDALR